VNTYHPGALAGYFTVRQGPFLFEAIFDSPTSSNHGGSRPILAIRTPTTSEFGRSSEDEGLKLKGEIATPVLGASYEHQIVYQPNYSFVVEEEQKYGPK
jgi:hypothetical protein